ncbi:Cytochrome P450 [Drechslerella dactyloides]|uniref:Cytochrome P450 n=1 Tax=Drechslerella dactyloides TaxID=74499 RepID=A0AAD6NIR1_DREDA|nr:Cytochrome P450 [Drechslerella dactyloides]
MNSSVPNAAPDAATGLLGSLVSSLTPTNIALYTLLAALLPIVYTFTVSTLNDGKPTKDGEPPVPPYWMPFIGHAFGLVAGQEKMVAKYRKVDGKPGGPRTIYAFGQRIYLLTDPAAVSLMYRKSRTVVFDPLIELTLAQLFGGPPSAFKALAPGLPGVDQTGLEGKPEWCKLVHAMYVRELNPKTPSLENMTRIFVRELSAQLEENVPAGGEYMEVDLFAWIKKIMFPASGRALYGKKLRLTDELARNFWHWDKAFLQLFKMYPDFMIPGVRAARQAVTDELIRWRMEVKELRDQIADDVLWEENFGARLVRDRVKLTEMVLAEDDHQAHAAIHLSLLWGLEANAIPVASWVIAFALLTPGVLERLKEELAMCVETPATSASWPTFDVDKLGKLPFLNAVWQEALRLGTASISPRMVLEDTEFGGYMFKKGGMIQGLNPVAQIEEEYWGKSVATFNPDRWLPYPGEDAATAARRVREYQTRMRPFGGGLSICPGRHFAGQEILATVAVMAMGLEWKTEGIRAPDIDRSFFGAGGLPPKNDVRLRVRRAQ